nr:unnamed protein product [Digitaria exilis]
MCDYFLQRMEGGHHHQAGDLTDVVRAGGAMPDLSSTPTAGWHLQATEPAGAGPGLFPPPPQPSSSDGPGPSGDGFGDAFAGLATDFFDFEAPPVAGGGALVDSGGGGGGVMAARGMMPALSPREIRPYSLMMAGGGDAVKLGVPAMMPGGGLAVGPPPCAFDAAVAGMMQMPSPHGGGIKRRKNQARKVVCIPAPAASAGGRTTGEVVPSDLWAWRKYGQKPIKGSPYPSKNNSSHNLQKPTVKSDPDQTAAAAASATTATAANSTTTTTTTSTASNSTPTTTMAVKEEAMVGSEMEKGIEHHVTSVEMDHGDLMQQMFNQSYRPMIPEGGHHVDDFFADLAELESDPMSLIFPGGDSGKEKATSKNLGADSLFNMLDWGTSQ